MGEKKKEKTGTRVVKRGAKMAACLVHGMTVRPQTPKKNRFVLLDSGEAGSS